MKTTTPGFTAEASLYNTSRHYRARYRAPGPHTNTAGTIRPSEIDVPGEVIDIEDDAPWSPPSWGGHTGPGTTTGGADTGAGEPGGGGGGDGGIPSQKDPLDKPSPGMHGCSTNQAMSDAAGPCYDKINFDLMNGVKNAHYLQCTGNRKGNVVHPNMQCCQKVGKRTVCEPL